MLRAAGVLTSQSIDPVQLLRDGCGCFTPGQVSIGIAGSNITCRLGGTTKVDGRDDLRRVVEHRIVHVQVLSMVGDGFAAPQLADDIQELPATLIALRFIQ